MSACVWLAALALVVFSVSVAGGCARGGPGTSAFENENDSLRRIRNELQEEVRKLKERNANLAAEVEMLKQRLDEKVTSPPGLSSADVPRLARLEFGRHSGALDKDGDGAADLIRIYLHTLDQAGRFLPVAAVADVQAVAIDPGKAPVMLGERHFDADTFSAAYRSGLTGAHYTIELPLVTPPAASLTDITVKVTLRDAATGATVSHERAMAVGARMSSK